MQQVEAGTGSLSSNVWANIAVAYGVLSFQFDIHPSLLAIQVDMKSRYKIGLAVLYGFGGTISCDDNCSFMFKKRNTIN